MVASQVTDTKEGFFDDGHPMKKSHEYQQWWMFQLATSENFHVTDGICLLQNLG